MVRAALILPLLLWSCKDETVSGWSDPTTIWTLEEMAGAPVPFAATLSFPEEGVVRGRGPCNRFSARQIHPYPWIGIDALAATRVACPDLAGERAFFAALRRMTLVEASDAVLILTDGAGGEMVFRATD